jgi:hypothetical protein
VVLTGINSDVAVVDGKLPECGAVVEDWATASEVDESG